MLSEWAFHVGQVSHRRGFGENSLGVRHRLVNGAASAGENH